MPEPHLRLVDGIVIASYFLALLVIGLYYRRFAGRSMEDYFLSGRRNSGWANGVSYAAAMMNADVAPTYSGLTVATGLFICWWYLSRFGPALFVGAILFAVFWRRLNLFTTPEFYELRFGGLASSVIRTWIALRSSLIAMVAWTGTGLLAMHKIAAPVLGIRDTTVFGMEVEGKTVTIGLVVPMVLIYAGFAGFSGVVATAGLQSLIMFIGSAMLCGIVLFSMGGPAELASRLVAITGAETVSAFPPVHHDVFPAAAAICWLIGTTIGYGGDTAPLGGAMEGQCLQSSRNTREASKMYVVAEVTLFVLLLLVTLPSLAAIVDWPELRAGSVDREQAYGLLMARYLPPGMLGLLAVVMLAAVMSTIASNLIFGGQVLVNDVYKRYLAPAKTDRHYLWAGRLGAIIILALALMVAYNVDLIFDVAVFMVGAAVAEMPANWAQWWWWRFNRWGRLAASFGGMLLPALIWFVLPTRDWAWWDRTYLALLANTVLWIVVTLVTPPDSPQVLDRFYRRALPLGFWGQVRGRCEAVLGGGTNGERRTGGIGLIAAGLLLALLGSGSVMLLTVGVSQLMVAHHAAAAATIAGGLLGGFIFLRIYGRYLDRLDRWAPVEALPAALTTPGIEASELTGAAGGGTAATGLVSADATRTPFTSAPDPSGSVPVPTGIVVAVATAGFGLVITLLGLVGTRGRDLAYNLLGGGAFFVAALIVFILSRGPAVPARQPTEPVKHDLSGRD